MSNYETDPYPQSDDESEQTMYLEDAIIYLEDQYRDVETKGKITPGPRPYRAAICHATPMFPPGLDLADVESVAVDESDSALERRMINIGLKYLISQGETLYEGDFVEFVSTNGCSEHDITSYILIGDSIEPLERHGDYFVPHRKLAYPRYSFAHWERAHRTDGFWINVKEVKLEVNQEGQLVIDGKWFIEQYDEENNWKQFNKEVSQALKLLLEREDVKAICVSPFDDLPHLRFEGELSDETPKDSASEYIAGLLSERNYKLFMTGSLPVETSAGLVGIQSEQDHDVAMFFAKTELPCAEACRKVLKVREDRAKEGLETVLVRPVVDMILAYLM